MVRVTQAKDYIDIDALIYLGGLDLAKALAAGQVVYGKSFVPELTLKALSYFDDGNLGSLSRAIRERLALAVRGVDLDNLPEVISGSKNTDGGRDR